MSSSISGDLRDIYRSYIQAILNGDVDSMHEYVSETVSHNGKQLGLQGYKELLLGNIINNDIHIEIKRLVADDSHIAAVLIFTTSSSTKELVGIELDSQPFSYVENVIYDFKDGKIAEVHSLFDIDTVRSHARQL
ncbi:hypothetical protein PMZ80_010211 [Knufia obscura]|uniref:Ester cyclase n=2 Tax=Knufia TaxID=430999 RepID=A0AAN8EP58_9EURO|nr:hypothetical protein PMZ80_010211 [Knufia obscura]KAK5952950.1 hypothetical protein OHC33_006071 [Knufia fluminis]